MFGKKKKCVRDDSRQKTFRFDRCSGAALLALLTLLFAGPALATDPIDIDPDPDGAPTILWVHASDPIDVASLPPGNYVIVVQSDEGPDQVYEVSVQ